MEPYTQDTAKPCPVCGTNVEARITLVANIPRELIPLGPNAFRCYSPTVSISCPNPNCRISFADVPGDPEGLSKIQSEAEKKYRESHEDLFGTFKDYKKTSKPTH